jgi:flagellar biosynthesis protein FlhF
VYSETEGHNMRMKSYFAGSVQLAMEQARRELGSEAILVTSRLAPAEAGKDRRYEVVFATEAPEKRVDKPAQPALATQTPARPNVSDGVVSAASLDAVLGEIKGIREQIRTWLPHAGAASPTGGKPEIGGGRQERELLAHLTNADVDPDLAQQLIASALERSVHRPPPEPRARQGRFADVLKAVSASVEAARDLRSALTDSIIEVFRVETGLADLKQSPVVMAMIGPPGAGKTAAIAKIAVRYGMGGNGPALLLSCDNMRVAAPEQLRGYAAVLGLQFAMAQSPRALGQLLEDHRGYRLILIDTPGFSSGDFNEAGELAQFLAARAGIQKHLVLPAPARCADMDRICSAYEIFRPSHLLFSRMDETTVFGPALSGAMGRNLPVSFFSMGAKVSEDITEASADFIADRLLPAKSDSQKLAAAA